MALGAFAGVVGADSLGLGAASLLAPSPAPWSARSFSLLVVRWRANEVVVGFAFALAGSACATFLYRSVYEQRPSLRPLPFVDVPLLERLPLLGPVLFRQPVVVWLLPVVLGIAFGLRSTRAGLELRRRAMARLPPGPRASGSTSCGAWLRCWPAPWVASAGRCSPPASSASSPTRSSATVFVALALVIAARWRPLLLLPAAWDRRQAFQLAQADGGFGLPVELVAGPAVPRDPGRPGGRRRFEPGAAGAVGRMASEVA